MSLLYINYINLCDYNDVNRTAKETISPANKAAEGNPPNNGDKKQSQNCARFTIYCLDKENKQYASRLCLRD